MTSSFFNLVIVIHWKFNCAKNGDHPLDEWFLASTAPIRTEFQPLKTCQTAKSGKYFQITSHPSSEILALDWLFKYRMLIGRENWLKSERTLISFTYRTTPNRTEKHFREPNSLYRTINQRTETEHIIRRANFFFLLVFFEQWKCSNFSWDVVKIKFFNFLTFYPFSVSNSEMNLEQWQVY